MNVKAFIQRNPVVAYFLMTFLISWGGALAMIAPGLWIVVVLVASYYGKRLEGRASSGKPARA